MTEENIGETRGIETRSAAVDNVDFGQRIITVIAVPYEQPAEIMFRNEMWKEVFVSTAFNGIETRQSRIPANREHRPDLLIGRVIEARSDPGVGLITDVKISRTDRGDEALALADDEALSASAGFMVKDPYRDQVLDRRSKTRRITRAFLDHLAFVGQPAYSGAKILAMRDADGANNVDLPPERPLVDQYAEDPIFAWTRERLQ